jgi:F-type H+-transporting ATPase subunit b
MTHLLAQEGKTDNFLVPNATIVVELLLFLIILFVFYRYIVPPLTRAMIERDAMVRKAAEEREEATRRLQEAEERYQAALADARKEASAIRDEARAEAQRIRDEMRARTDEEVARIREQGEQQLAQQRRQVLDELRSDIGGLSTQLAGRIIGTPMGQDGPQQATVERFLADLDGDRESQPAEPQQSGGGTS